jgi:CDP-6-deoxy-D-xylo-4-hexulose-3-dehydrase
MKSKRISLVEDTISNEDIENLIGWLKTNPKLTKGEKTVEFEKKWSEYLGVEYSVFLNSGSSANLAMIYSLLLSGRLKNNTIIIPSVSWVTTVTPAIQFGMNPIMCDCDKENLGIDISHFKILIEKHKPSCVIIVHVLGIPNHMNEIIDLCKENDIILLEDTCESIGSEYHDKKLGTFGLMSSFSFYYGHHMSTIEGGMVSTNDEEIYHILLSIRSHGWDRDLPDKKMNHLRSKYSVNSFRALYTFYYPGFNLRATDLQAFIGLEQLKKIDYIVKKRNTNYNLYNELISNEIWKAIPPKHSYVSNFAFPLITENINDLVNEFQNNDIECRPLICGSMNEQPFWYERYGKDYLPNANKVHNYGLYIPNNPKLTETDIKLVSDIVNKFM